MFVLLASLSLVGLFVGIRVAQSASFPSELTCSDRAVVCTDGVITRIVASFYGYTGPIPTTWWLQYSTSLTYLDLSRNSFTGTIPTELTALSKLTVLDLSRNSLQGTIPTALGNLLKLSRLSLYSNQLYGNIPTEIGNCLSLRMLYLFNNNLVGSLPTELGNLIEMQYLFLETNKFTGLLPTQLGKLSKVRQIKITSNTFCGVIPNEVASVCPLNTCLIYDAGAPVCPSKEPSYQPTKLPPCKPSNKKKIVYKRKCDPRGSIPKHKRIRKIQK